MKNAAAKITSAVKPTAKAAKATVEHKDVVRDDEFLDDVMKRYEEAREALFGFFQAPTWKRTLCAFVTSLVVGAGIGWLAGTLLDWLVVGASVLAVPTFITMVVYVLGFIAAVFYGTKLAVRIGGAVLTGEADERAIAAYDAMKGAVKKLWPFGKQPEFAS